MEGGSIEVGMFQLGFFLFARPMSEIVCSVGFSTILSLVGLNVSRMSLFSRLHR